jgi:hypothetical protein
MESKKGDIRGEIIDRYGLRIKVGKTCPREDEERANSSCCI